MGKNFRAWADVKSQIDAKPTEGCYPREIWICSIGINVGVETDGKNEDFSRPILVVRVFNSEMIWAVPFTSRGKDSRFYHPVFWNGRTSWAILSQLRVISPRRLRRKVAVVSESDFAVIRRGISSLL